MSKVVTVEYYAKLQFTLEELRARHPWNKLRGIVSKESVDELEAIIEEKFPIEK